MDANTIIQRTKNWVLEVVIGLNLCPFAKKEFDQNKIRFSICDHATTQGLMIDLRAELMLLKANTEIETTLLIHPNVLKDFQDYNDFLEDVQLFLEESELEIDFQVASFHPQYQFAGSETDDVENYTNRSPYPMLHLLREHSLDQAIDQHPDTSRIPEKNQRLLRKMGKTEVERLLKKCLLS